MAGTNKETSVYYGWQGLTKKVITVTVIIGALRCFTKHGEKFKYWIVSGNGTITKISTSQNNKGSSKCTRYSLTIKNDQFIFVTISYAMRKGNKLLNLIAI